MASLRQVKKGHKENEITSMKYIILMIIILVVVIIWDVEPSPYLNFQIPTSISFNGDWGYSSTYCKNVGSPGQHFHEKENKIFLHTYKNYCSI